MFSFFKVGGIVLPCLAVLALQCSNLNPPTGVADEQAENQPFKILGAVSAPWGKSDIGSVGYKGDATRSSDTFMVMGSGAGVKGTSDAFHYVSQSLSGNKAASACVIFNTKTGSSAKSGVMIRNSTSSNSRHISVSYTRNQTVIAEYRAKDGGSTVKLQEVFVGSLPCWVRAYREGSYYNAEYSKDSMEWIYLGGATISMNSSIKYGVFSTSGVTSALNASAFCRVYANNLMPTIWCDPENADLLQGNPAYFLVCASGPGITYQWQKAERFKYPLVYQDIPGATYNDYLIERVSCSDETHYRCVVSNGTGKMVSNPALLTVHCTSGLALIVAGTAFDDNAYFTKNIAPNCNFAYQNLMNVGYHPRDIYYMNPIGWQSLTDPYANSSIVDTTAMTVDVMRNYLLNPQIKSFVASGMPLTVYILGHGSSALNNGRVNLSRTEYLIPDTLAKWLDSYDASPSSGQIVVVLDFCYSGSFQNKLRNLNNQRRVVITSTDASNSAYFTNGKCFSWNIWNDIYRGQDLWTCFVDAQDWSNMNAPGVNKANPQANADNNGIFNSTADADIMRTIHYGIAPQ